MNDATLWTARWTRKLLDFLFWIRLRAASQGCRNLLRTSARKGGAGTEPRIRTVRKLAAAAGDGSLGFSGSPGQLETSLNSGYSVGPCNSYLEGPTLVFGVCSRPLCVWACCSRNRAWTPPPSSSLAEERAPLLSLRFVQLAPLAEAGAHEPLPSSLASQTKEHVCSLTRPGQRRASLAPCGGARFADARSNVAAPSLTRRRSSTGRPHLRKPWLTQVSDGLYGLQPNAERQESTCTSS